MDVGEFTPLLSLFSYWRLEEDFTRVESKKQHQPAAASLHSLSVKSSLTHPSQVPRL